MRPDNYVRHAFRRDFFPRGLLIDARCCSKSFANIEMVVAELMLTLFVGHYEADFIFASSVGRAHLLG